MQSKIWLSAIVWILVEILDLLNGLTLVFINRPGRYESYLLLSQGGIYHYCYFTLKIRSFQVRSSDPFLRLLITRTDITFSRVAMPSIGKFDQLMIEQIEISGFIKVDE